MRDYKLVQLQMSIDSTHSPELFESTRQNIEKEYRGNQTKFAGEGIVFLAIIFVGAAFLYRSVRRQFRMQQQQQNFMMAVTHELKTPIAVARINLETMQKHNLDPEKQRKLIRKTLEETTRLNSLTNNILVASQLEGGGHDITREDVNLSDLLKDVMADFRHRFPERIFEEKVEEEMDLKGDPLLLQIMVNNLVENAIKYSPKESTIKALLRKENGNIYLEIADEGEGIPDAEKTRIFEKFYRIGNENTRKTQGTGLGLYLCSKIARDHNADISVTNNHPQGSIFAVSFHQ
jgi:signal transduction histidine kinase